MFSFLTKKNRTFTDFSTLHTDLHSHLIPGIDDGAKTLEDSLAMITQLANMGYQRIITTPHIMGEYYPNNPEIIRSGLEKVKKVMVERNINLDIQAAAEYYLDDYFEKLLAEDTELLTFSDQRILVEFSMLSDPANGYDLLFQLTTRGYHPILAHPERYLYFGKRMEKFEQIKNLGVEFQTNLLSLAGYYGREQKKLGIKLLRNGMIDYLGTDLHRESQLKSIRSISDREVNKLLGTIRFKNADL